MSDKYGEALGIWHLEVGGADLELKPGMIYLREFRKLSTKYASMKDKSGLYDEFERWFIKMLRQYIPPADEAEKARQDNS